MPRATWKGAIVFGLVHIPVDLYPGARDNDLDFDWIDRRDMAPVGYQRINKKTGKPVDAKSIVKGYQYDKGQYVLLSDEDFRLANPKATQTVEIVAFVDRAAIPPPFYDTPYRLAPGKRGEKGYALLREVLRRTGRAGVAQVVIRTRQHLALLVAEGDLLLLETLRYADEVLDDKDLELPGARTALGAKELELAQRLVDDMTVEWKAGDYRDTYRDDLMARIKAKIKAGETEVLTEPGETAEPARGAEVIDLMAALKRSLGETTGTAGNRRKPAGAAARKTAKRKEAGTPVKTRKRA
jgi:DNA end-binding protein Ku